MRLTNLRAAFTAMIMPIVLLATAQPAPHQMIQTDSWQVSVNEMEQHRRERITTIAEELQEAGMTRSFGTDILKAVGFSAISTLVDVVATETVNLAKYRKRQKAEWMRMIQNECNYTDSISSIKGLKDFYKENSSYGALDPSNINFDGITIRGMRNGDEVVFITCHIDTTRLEHLFRHSKFHLVIDSIAFNPFVCHLPNLAANGIRLMEKSETERDNSFTFSERNHLTIGMEMELYSSWINEAVMIQQNVKLGTFKFNVTIPDHVEIYHYSRAQIQRNIDMLAKDPSLRNPDGSPLDTQFVEMEGDCFVVPRSFMPLCQNERMWGTGEYNIKVKFRETCQFSQDETTNEKLKHWHKDYEQLRKMQKKSSEVNEYFRTIWNQNKDNIIKTTVKQGLNTSLQSAGLSSSASAAGMSAAAAAAMMKAGAAGAAGAAAGATPPAMPK
ncbi:MAG: hypothetical protein ACI31F_06655 [Muribaculaceae bacterium]